MKLHILESFTAEHVLDLSPEIDDVFYVDSGKQIGSYFHQWMQYNTGWFQNRWYAIDIEEWLTENNIPQNPKEWSESDMLRFQLRFS